ncbi:MAG: GNAT family N-acetyltransferase [Huintestinicola sp.]|uniref:GNAT family N-acetyltransferase n=1 Tax=Huintestinicola sp. TaxID=2981661 RepID=UPI003F09B454
MDRIIIRNETESDHREVETLIREAFWNLNVPGCDEHYLAHMIRSHYDLIPELDLVAELDGRIIGSVMYTRSHLTDESGNEMETLTFGPLAVLPGYQRMGVGKALLERSFEIARNMGYEVIVIFGSPANYIARGFKSCKKFNICPEGNIFPTAMLVKELKEGALDGRKMTFHESIAFNYDCAEAEKFDSLFPPKQKEYRASQEEFYIYSHSSVN